MSPLNPNWELPEIQTDRFGDKSSRYAVLIPVLNEGLRIKNQLIRMQSQMKQLDTWIVDGGSQDGATDTEKLATTGLKGVVRLKTQKGLSSQMRAGLGFLLGEGYVGIILIDGNNKDDPAAIPLFAEKLAEGLDHIQGSRFIPGGVAIRTPWMRLLGIKILHAPLISIASGFRYTDTTNGFRAYSEKLLRDERVSPFRNIFQTYELHYYLAIQAAKIGFKVAEIPVTREYPAGEKAPTKIRGFMGNLKVLRILFASVAGKYNP